ncbi:MAG: protoheme IX farnesyltransferase [Deltaproteobacteria bacterium GWC2_42_11]|nr:MAG: protoheme IX farnesyltransferase [Deltaproteobacteria bacterium GWC2_42_11]HBO83918.1 protoheme IX farnesyltransferase [Deltaproteobacteria bacterium]
MTDIKRFLPLFKLRIAVLITFSAIVGSIAAGNIPFDKMIILIVATMMASMGAAALNHYFDRDIDILMCRTSKRPIATGAVKTPVLVLLAGIVLLIVSFLVSTLALNYLVSLHLFLGAFVYAVIYTVWLKRRSWFNIIIGGLAGSFAVLAGGASAAPFLCMPPILLAVVMFFWTPSHFWSFAIVHKEEYRKAGVPMLPVLISDKRTSVYILINTVFLVLSSLIPTMLGYLGLFYLVSALGIGLFFITRNIQLVANPSKDMAWKNFKASMVYLAVLFSALIIDVLV